MKTTMREVPLRHLTLISVMLALGAPSSWADEHDEEPFPVGRLFFQLNDTDEDLGIHLLVDGDPWKKLEIDDPNDRRIFYVNAQGRLRRQGITEFKFESAEPEFDEFPADRFFRRFPEGEYDIEAMRHDGGEYETTALISHVLPAPPALLAVDGDELPDECDEEIGVFGPPVSATPLIEWGRVTTSHPDIGDEGPIQIVRYEVAVERDEVLADDEMTVLKPALKLEANLEVLAGEHVEQFQVPPDLLSTGDEVKFQILVQATNGNETSSESCFVVNGDAG